MAGADLVGEAAHGSGAYGAGGVGGEGWEVFGAGPADFGQAGGVGVEGAHAHGHAWGDCAANVGGVGREQVAGESGAAVGDEGCPAWTERGCSDGGGETVGAKSAGGGVMVSHWHGSGMGDDQQTVGAQAAQALDKADVYSGHGGVGGAVDVTFPGQTDDGVEVGRGSDDGAQQPVFVVEDGIFYARVALVDSQQYAHLFLVFALFVFVSADFLLLGVDEPGGDNLNHGSGECEEDGVANDGERPCQGAEVAFLVEPEGGSDHEADSGPELHAAQSAQTHGSGGVHGADHSGHYI